MELVFRLMCEIDNVALQRAKPKPLANLKLSIKLDKETAKGKIDPKLERLAFSGMGQEKLDDGAQTTTFPYRSINLGEELEPHVVKILGYELNTTPKLASITPAKNERAVYLTFIVPFVLDDEKDALHGKLAREMIAEHMVEVEIAPAQGELFDRGGAGASAGDDDDEEEKPAGGKAKRKPKGKQTVVNAKKNFGHADPKVVS